MSTPSFTKWLLLGLALLTYGCPDTHCQSGPKYGTQCYTQNDAEEHQKQRR